MCIRDRAIAGSLLGSVTVEWFRKTKLGIWFFNKVSNMYDWAADRYNLKVLDIEEEWKKKHPNIAFDMERLEKRIKKLEENA